MDVQPALVSCFQRFRTMPYPAGSVFAVRGFRRRIPPCSGSVGQKQDPDAVSRAARATGRTEGRRPIPPLPPEAFGKDADDDGWRNDGLTDVPPALPRRTPTRKEVKGNA